MLNVKLVVVGGAPEGDEFPLDLPCVLGRAREASLPLPHPLVSRTHCELTERDGKLFVKDLGSTNGTFVGKERIQESVVHHGDLLTVGTVTFRANFIGQPILAVENAKPDSKAGRTPNSQVDQDTSAITRVDTDVEIQVHKPAVRRKQKAK